MKTCCSSTVFLMLALTICSELAAPLAISAQQAPETAAASSQPFRKILYDSAEWIKGKYSTPGISVDVREVGRLNKSGASGKQYGVHVQGAPKGQTYSLLQWPITAADAALATPGITINADGLAVRADRTPLTIATSAAPGEVLRLELLSEDHAVKAFFSIIPQPIIKEDHGCSVEAVRLMPHFELALIRGTGFQPNDAVQFSSKTYDDWHLVKAMADANGEYVSALVPLMKDKRKGKTTVKLTGARCDPEISFEWGK